MKDLKETKERVYTIILVSYIVLSIGAGILISKDRADQVLPLIIVGNISLLSISMYFITLHIKNTCIKIGSALVFFTTIIHIGFILFGIKLGYLGYVFTVIYIIGFVMGLKGLLNNIQYQVKQNNHLKLFSNISELVYFESNLLLDQVKIEFSDGFIKKYNLSYSKLNISNTEFYTYIHHDDFNLVIDFSKKLEQSNELSFKFRVKYPGMNEYIWMFSRNHLDDNQNIVGIDLDYSIIHKLQSDVIHSKEILSIKEKNEQLLLEHSTDLIAKIEPTGKIIFVSKTYSEIFPYTVEELIGKNVIEINESIGVTDNKWFKDTLKPPYTTSGISKVERNGSYRWVSWKNDAVVNKEGEVEFVVVVGHDITEITNLNDKLRLESIQDSLTGLLNRRGLNQFYKQMDQYEQIIAFFIDIDNFNTINDYYGHEIGDQILVLFSSELKTYEKYGCTIYRLSGDEFLIIYTGKKEDGKIQQLRASILEHVDNIYKVNDIKIVLNISVGYAVYPDDTDDLDKLISYSDLAMFEAKHNQYNNCVRYDPSMLFILDQKVAMANEIKEALEKDCFEIYFQPIIDVKENNICYLEALARWNNKKRGWISPPTFISIAVNSGLIIKLDLYLIEKSLENYTKIIKDQQYNNTKLTVNVSPQTLLKENFPNILKDLILKYQLDFTSVCIEISEKTFVNNIKHCLEQILKIKEFGIEIALDDFGREYSSLAILDTLEFDIIKIDKLFIDKIGSKGNYEIVKMIMNISKIANKKVIAEGIETEEQKNKLLALGCKYHQGYYYQKPRKLI